MVYGFGNRPIKDELIFHADTVSEYACTIFRNILKSYKLVKQSKSRKGNYRGNAVTDFFLRV
jgi:hypothetical protein